MKKLIALLMIVLLLAGCSGRKSNDSPITAKPEQPAVKPAAEDPSEKYYGTWRSSAVYTNDVRFDMEQIAGYALCCNIGGAYSFYRHFVYLHAFLSIYL